LAQESSESVTCVHPCLVKSMQLLTLLPVVWCSLVRDELDVAGQQPPLPLWTDAEAFQVPPGVLPATLRAPVAPTVPLGERAEVPTMAHHVQKKATKHHHHSRPRKSRPSDINRKAPVYPEIPDIPVYTVLKKAATSDETAPEDAAPASRAGEPQMMANRPHLNRPKLNKPADQREAMLRALTTEVLRHGRIRCTLARAKEVRRHVDHMVTLAKDGSLHARRQALGYLYDKQLVHGIFEQVPERYQDRKGGYTRVVKDGFRRGDNAEMGIIELV